MESDVQKSVTAIIEFKPMFLGSKSTRSPVEKHCGDSYNVKRRKKVEKNVYKY